MRSTVLCAQPLLDDNDMGALVGDAGSGLPLVVWTASI